MWNEVSINWVGETNYWLAETGPRVEGRNSSSPPKKKTSSPSSEETSSGCVHLKKILRKPTKPRWSLFFLGTPTKILRSEWFHWGFHPPFLGVSTPTWQHRPDPQNAVRHGRNGTQDHNLHPVEAPWATWDHGGCGGSTYPAW